MFQCKVCSGNPFAQLFGNGDEPRESKAKIFPGSPFAQFSGGVDEPRESKARICSGSPFSHLFGSEDVPRDSKGVTQPAPLAPTGSRSPDTFRPRTDAEVTALVQRWKDYIHPRAEDFFPEGQLEVVLAQLIRGIDRSQDPILGSEDACIFWYGDILKATPEAVIRMVKPGQREESVTYVNRVLTFIFAGEEDFVKLMKLPKEPFKMVCGDQMCVHLGHISVPI